MFTIAVAAVCLDRVWWWCGRSLRCSENDRLLRRNNARQQQLAHRATHDDLTDLPNRALFEQPTHEALARPDARSASR